MEETLYHDDQGIQNYLNFLCNDEKLISTREVRLNAQLYRDRETSIARSLRIEIKGFDSRKLDNLIDLKRFIILENMHDPENICDFERITVYNEWLVITSKDGSIQIQERPITRIAIGRVNIPGIDDVLNLHINSSLCSKLHCQIKFDEFFGRPKVPFGFYAMLYLFENKLNTCILYLVLKYLGRDNTPANIVLTEMGSYLGTWLNLTSPMAEMSVGNHFYIDKAAYIKVESIFHKEFDQIVKEVDSHNMQKLTLNPANKPHYTIELLKLFKTQKLVHTNYGVLKLPDYESCVKCMLDDDSRFSLVAISTNMEDKSFTENFLMVCLNDSRNMFDFGGIAINFSNKKFILEVKDIVAKMNIINFWKSISVKDGDRFKYGEIKVGQDNCFMIQSAVFRLKCLQYL